MVIITFIGIILAIGFTDILMRSFTIQEVQSTMDVAGVSALQIGVDQTKLRVEIFDVDEHVVESEYERMVSEILSQGDRIQSFHFIRTDVEQFTSNFGIGGTGKSRPQARLDSQMVIVVDNSQLFDLIPGAYKTFYDSKDGEYFDVNFNGITEDGNVELIVRSVSRVVYR